MKKFLGPPFDGGPFYFKGVDLADPLPRKPCAARAGFLSVSAQKSPGGRAGLSGVVVSVDLLPGQLQFPLVDGAIPQIQINQRLVRDARRLGLGLEVVDGVAVQIDGDLPFEMGGVGVFSWVQVLNVIFFSHNCHLAIPQCMLFFRFWLPSERK